MKTLNRTYDPEADGDRMEALGLFTYFPERDFPEE